MSWHHLEKTVKLYGLIRVEGLYNEEPSSSKNQLDQYFERNNVFLLMKYH